MLRFHIVENSQRLIVPEHEGRRPWNFFARSTSEAGMITTSNFMFMIVPPLDIPKKNRRLRPAFL
jgi:hypothetical protein